MLTVDIVQMSDDVYRLVSKNTAGEITDIFESSFRNVVSELLKLQNPNTNLRIRTENRKGK